MTVLRSPLFPPLHSALRSPLAPRKGGGFDWYPGVLYQPGDILLWYDPSDLTTMYQDVAGTSPVTADGQSVLLMLDKGQWGGKALTQVLAAQPELRGDVAIVSTGTPAETATYNTATGAAYSYRLSPNASGVWLQNVTSGRFYRVAISGISGSALGIRVAGNGLLGTPLLPTITTAGVYLIQANSAQFFFAASGDGNISFTLDSIKEIPGYHRTQATPSQAPKYKTGPNPAAAENSPELVTNGTFDTDTTGWATVAATATLASVSGELEVTNVGAAAGVAQLDAFTTVIGRSYRVTGIARRGTSSSITIEARASGGSGLTSITLTDTANRPFEFVFTATSVFSVIWLVSNQAVTGRTGYFDNISVREIPASAPYIHWLLYDGTDDGNATPSINWGTDEVAICAGVTKSSDAAAGAFAELSATSASNNGTFAMLAPASAAANYYWRSKGTGDANMTVTTYTAPTTNVLTGQGKIATDLATLRADGAQVGTSATDQGTGNFGNYPLYFGRRGGSSLPFNGKEHSFVARSRLFTASEEAKLETFTAAKTGVIL